MKKQMFALVLSFTAAGILSHQRSEAQYAVQHSVFGNGTAAVADTNQISVGTLGQPVIGEVQSQIHTNQVGFWYQAGVLISSVEQFSTSLPTEYRLQQNYPNPFNPTTTILFALPKRSSVALKMYDRLGRDVAILVDEELQPGIHKVTVDARGLPTGIYFYRLQTEDFIAVKKALLVK